jgi:hypothetical protein
MSDPVSEHTIDNIESQELVEDAKMHAPSFRVEKNEYAPRVSKIFKAITEFTDQLNDAFGKEDVNVNKVYRIIAKTSLTNRKVVNRHVVIFHDFVTHNRIPILGRVHDKLVVPSIQLTERIGMNMSEIIEKADEPTRAIIWQHFFNIMFLFNPEDTIVKNELKVAIANNDTRENKFLKDTFSKFEQVMKSNDGSVQKDPMAMMSGLLQSGFLNDMIGNINNGVNKGDLNIKSLISNVQHLLGNLSETIEREEKTEK